MASLTSFEIQSTYRFTTIFDPFLMGALLVWKVIVPFILVGCVFQTINHRLNIPASATFFLVVAMSDVMSMNFFFLVKDSGSWKDIGMSISHFGLVNAFTLIQLGLFALCQVVLRNVSNDTEKHK